MKALVKKFLDKDISRRGFMQSMAAMGFSLKAMDSVLNSVAYAAEELHMMESRLWEPVQR